MLTRKEECSVWSIEIEGIPRDYLGQKQESASQARIDTASQKTEGFLGSLLYSKLSSSFSIHVSKNKARLLFSASTNPSGPRILGSSFSSQFPRFSVSLFQQPVLFTPDQEVLVTQITGVPKQALDSTTSLTEMMLRSKGEMLYQVWAIPRKPRFYERFIANKKYKHAIERAQEQQTAERLFGSGTKTKINPDALRASQHLEALYRRMNSKMLLDCRVIIATADTGDNEANLRTAVSILLSSISPTDRDQQLKVKYLRGKKARKALDAAEFLQKYGKGTSLLPSEAVPLFTIPRIDLGLRATSPASFTTSGATPVHHESQETPFTPGEVALGRVYRGNKLSSSVKRIDLQQLRMHAAIVGMTGMGKTTTKNRIVIDAWKNGISSLLIEPTKTDARILMGAIPELRVFTLGKEQVAPFRSNPFWLEEGVSIQTHINLLYSCFVAGWPLYGMLSNRTRRVINNTYLNNGWDPLREVRGAFITLEMFRDEVARYCEESLGYGSELTQDFRGALMGRADDLCEPSRAAIFNTVEDLSMEELFSVPSIIELKHLGDPDFTAFTLSLLMVRVFEYFDILGPSDRLRALLVIDEAHHVLEEMPKVAEMSEMAVAKQKVVDQFVNLLAEARSLGLGIVLADQIPTRLARDALKNCVTKIVHRLTSPDDRELMALETGCNPEQGEHIAALGIGDVVISDLSDIVPSNVRVFNDAEFISEMKAVWTDDEVRERMRPFYEAHPRFAETPRIPEPVTFGSSPTYSPPEEVAYRVDELVQTIAFRDLYMDALEDLEADPSSLALEEVIAEYTLGLSHLRASPMVIAQTVFETASATHGLPLRGVNMSIVRQILIEDAEGSVDRNRVGGGHTAP